MPDMDGLKLIGEPRLKHLFWLMPIRYPGCPKNHRFCKHALD